MQEIMAAPDGRCLQHKEIKQFFHPSLIVTSTHLSTFLSWTFGTVLNLCFLK